MDKRFGFLVLMIGHMHLAQNGSISKQEPIISTLIRACFLSEIE